MSTIVLPGQSAAQQHPNLKLGPGLVHAPSEAASAVAKKAGAIQHSPNNARWWIDTHSRRYIPSAQESVVGIVNGKTVDGYRVDIGAAHNATLDALAFDGATKRNKPNLKIGSLMYARVSLAHKDMDPELECFDAQSHKSEGFGELKGGFMLRCSLQMCRLLLDPSHFLLPFLGQKFPLEVAVGVNGRVWVDAKDPRKTIAVVRCIEACDPDQYGATSTRTSHGPLTASGVGSLLGQIDIG